MNIYPSACETEIALPENRPPKQVLIFLLSVDLFLFLLVLLTSTNFFLASTIKEPLICRQ